MKKILLILFFITSFLVSTFGINVLLTTHNQENSSACVSNYDSQSCSVPFDHVVEHLQQWKQFFYATPIAFSTVFFLMGLFIIYFFNLFRRFSFLSLPIISAKLYEKRLNTIGIFDPLMLAFSNGLIHPKIFPNL